jgi:hypothetical protein
MHNPESVVDRSRCSHGGSYSTLAGPLNHGENWRKAVMVIDVRVEVENSRKVTPVCDINDLL